MKVLVVNNMAPFVRGGAESLAENLVHQLQVAGHKADLLRVPFQWEPAATIPSQMLLARTLELDSVDHVIALKFPAYLIQHPEKTLWLAHQYRQAYDLNVPGQTNLTGEEGDRIRELIEGADNLCFSKARRLFAISDVTQERLARFNGFHAEVLRAPLNDPELFVGGPPQGYVFAGGRVNGGKRQHLLVEAMAHASPTARLVVAGPPDSDEDRYRLEQAVERLGLSDRVTLDLRFLDRKEYADYLNGATAVASLPFDEESFSYVAMEAATAEKPIISTTDSGGVLGLAIDGATGWVTAPTPEALATALNASTTKPSRAASYGKAAKSRWENLGINWPNTVTKLLS